MAADPLGPLIARLSAATQRQEPAAPARRVAGGLRRMCRCAMLSIVAVTLLPAGACGALLAGGGIVLVLLELARLGRLHAAAISERDAVSRVFKRVIADNFDGVLLVGGDGRIRAASAAAPALLGRSGSLVGRRAASVLPDAVAQALLRSLSAPASAPPGPPAEVTLGPPGGRRSFAYRATLADPAGLASAGLVCLTLRDTTAARRGARQLADSACRDPVTGLLTRAAFVAAVQSGLRTDAQRDHGATVLCVDIAGCELAGGVVDHAFANDVLRYFARQFQHRGMHALARLGDAGFALARTGVLPPPQLTDFAETLVTTLGRPFRLGGHQFMPKIRVGATTTDLSGFAGDVLLDHAATALVGGGSAVTLFDPALIEMQRQRQIFELALRRALNGGQFVVHYQPQIELQTGRFVGVEALLRWRDPALGQVAPNRFIALAEETGLICDLGRFVLATACRDLAEWPADVRLAVNLSPAQFRFGDPLADIAEALAASGMPPQRLEIEITEGVLAAEQSGMRDGLTRLRASGVGIVLDDFGTGYSSLAYLDRLPADALKLDRGFVAEITQSPSRRAIVAAIIALARALGKTTVGEGIETPEQAQLLARLGCTYGQGYLYDPALPIEQLTARYRSAYRPGRRVG